MHDKLFILVTLYGNKQLHRVALNMGSINSVDNRAHETPMEPDFIRAIQAKLPIQYLRMEIMDVNEIDWVVA